MSVSFELNKPIVDYVSELREWSVTECRPYARVADERHSPPDNWQSILETTTFGLGRIDMPDAERVPEFEDGKWVIDLAFYENVTYGDPWVSPLFGRGIGHLVVEAMGTPEQVEKWYTPVIEGSNRTAFALTEPDFGSDTSHVSTTAIRDGDSWIINGTKIVCTGGAPSEYVTVFATTDKSLGAKGIAAFSAEGFARLHHRQIQRVQTGDSQLGYLRAVVSGALFRWRTGWDGRVPGQPRIRRKSMGTAGR